jgi:uncharacterized membrane protein (UPF0136 family)
MGTPRFHKRGYLGAPASRRRVASPIPGLAGKAANLASFFCAVPSPLPLDSAKHMSPNQILWIYIILLVVGGLIGFFKGKSQVSLIMSVAFAALLSLCAANIVFYPYVADILLAALLVVFAMRLTKTKKFMPAGMMLIITLAALALRHVHF